MLLLSLMRRKRKWDILMLSMLNIATVKRLVSGKIKPFVTLYKRLKKLNLI